MFEIGEYVIYGLSGACIVDNIEEKNINNEKQMYYVLKPVFENGTTIYAPFSTSDDKMKKILSSDEVYDLIDSIPNDEAFWIENESLRKNKFADIVKNGNHKELLCLLKSLYDNRTFKEKEGKKFHIADEKILLDAEKKIYQEFALILNITPEEVMPFIEKKLKLKAKNAKAKK